MTTVDHVIATIVGVTPDVEDTRRRAAAAATHRLAQLNYAASIEVLDTGEIIVRYDEECARTRRLSLYGIYAFYTSHRRSIAKNKRNQG